MGFALSILNVGIIIGPSIGGFLYDRFGYGSLFTAVFALVGLDIVLRLVVIEKKVAAKINGVDSESLPISPEAAARSAYGTFQPSEDTAIEERSASSSDIEQVPLLSNSTQKTGFVRSVKIKIGASSDSPSHPLPIVTMLTNPQILTDLYGAFVSIFILVSFDAAIPLFAERQFGWTSAQSGIVFLSISAPVLVGPLAGNLYDKYPDPWITASWFLLSAMLTTALSMVTYSGLGSTAQQALLYTLLFFYGLANSFGSLPLSADLTRALTIIEDETPGIFGDSSASAQVYALYTSASAAGVVVGPVWTTFIFSDGNWALLMFTLSLLTLSIAVPVLLTRRRPMSIVASSEVAVGPQSS